jgi:hypothetical protein
VVVSFFLDIWIDIEHIFIIYSLADDATGYMKDSPKVYFMAHMTGLAWVRCPM